MYIKHSSHITANAREDAASFLLSRSKKMDSKLSKSNDLFFSLFLLTLFPPILHSYTISSNKLYNHPGTAARLPLLATSFRGRLAPSVEDASDRRVAVDDPAAGEELWDGSSDGVVRIKA